VKVPKLFIIFSPYFHHMKVLMSVLYATSTINQANLIKRLIEEKGFEAEYKSTITLEDMRDPDVYGVLWFQLATVPFLGDAVVPYLLGSKPRAIYVTIEGIPAKSAVLHSNIPRCQFVANSYFTADCLKRAGLRVIDVVHHAIDTDSVLMAQQFVEQYRKQWDEKYGDRVKFLYVGRNDPRKALKKLSVAVDILNQEGVKDWVLLLHTEDSARELFKKENCDFVGSFGSLRYEQVLAMMGAVDYVIFPSVSEGFGLPVLEANAMGKPVLHCWMPPLSEFTSEDFNFVWEPVEKKLVNQGNAQYWVFHDYPEFILAEVMKDAIKIFKESKEEYEEYCMKAKEHAMKWDYRKIYPRLLKHIDIE